MPLSFTRFSTRLNGWGKFYFMKQIILNTMCYCHLIDVIGIVLVFALLMSPILYLIHRESRNNGK